MYSNRDSRVGDNIMVSMRRTLDSLNLTKEWVLRGEPTSETEFNQMFREITGADKNGLAIENDNPSDWSIKWSEVKKKYDELNAAEPLNELRMERNRILTQSDWVVIKEREEGGSVSNFADWKKYRQELRDITKTYKSLDEVKWPTAPSE